MKLLKPLAVGVVCAALIAYWTSPRAPDAPEVGMCRQLYKRAKTPADTLRIDHQIPLETGRGQLSVMTCGGLRLAYPGRNPGDTASLLVSHPPMSPTPDSTPAPPKAPELSDADLGVGGLLWNPDTADARRILGAPSLVRVHDDVIDDEPLHLTDWQYPGLLLTFSPNGHLRIARVTDARWQTHRGLRVGDSAERVVALYGPTDNDTGTELSYQLPGEPQPSRLGMFVLLAKRRVTTIAIGLIVNGD